MESILNKESRTAIELMVADGIITKEAAEKYFPELKKSSDEEIRKEIKKDAEAWYKEHYEGSNPQGRSIVIGAYIDGAITWFKKQVEQKPAESRQETKPNGGIVCEDFNEGDGYYKVNLAYLSKSQVELIENLVASWQKLTNDAAEWSKEDKETFGYLEDIVNFCYCNQYVVNVQTCERVRQLVFRLKSLCFQSGWGKDDITRINEIIETLNIVQANRVRTQRTHYSKATIDKNIDWLKSLRPRNTWKPSEEQIKALAYAVFDTQSYSYHKNLSSLEQQLKKLREE